MSEKPGKTEIQLRLFEEALDRLLRGEGRHITPGMKLSMARLAKESGVGSGTLYYKPYADFRNTATQRMVQFNTGIGENNPVDTNQESTVRLLRKERDNERRLKALYRKSCDELKAQVEQLCAERGALEHAFYQATLRIRELEQKFDAADTHPIDGLSAGDERAVQLPRNLQLVK